MTELTTVQEEEVRRLVKEPGATYDGIAKRLGVPASAVRGPAREAGLVRKRGPSPGNHRDGASYSRDDLAAAMADPGFNFAAFADAKGVSRQGVYAAARRWGLKRDRETAGCGQSILHASE